MSQISPPIRILLVLTVAVMGVYMLFLRPKPEEIPPLDSAGTTTTQPATVETEEPAAATAPATKADKPAAKAQAGGTAAKPAEDLKGLPKPLRKAIRADKVVVVMFSNGKSYDDKAVEKALTKVNRWDGRVLVHTAPLSRISRYGRIARGVSVEQSPTVVVADRGLRAQTLVGYVDRATIDQAVVDARRNNEGLYVDSYLKAADKVCFEYSNRVDSVPFFYSSNHRQIDRRYAEAAAIWPQFAADYKAVKPSAKWRKFHKATVADLQAYGAALNRFSVTVTPKISRPALLAAMREINRTGGPVAKRSYKRFADANLPRCGKQF